MLRRQPPRKTTTRQSRGKFTPTRWQQHVEEVYPDRHTRTYFLPPLYFKRVPHTMTHVAGETVKCLELPPSGKPGATKRPRRSKQQRSGSAGPTVPTPQVAGAIYTPCSSRDASTIIQESEHQDSSAQQRVLYHLRELSEQRKEIMMVISNLKFINYLNNKSEPLCARFPRVTNLVHTLHQGDFYLLIIHRFNGFIVGEVKSVKEADDKTLEDFLRAVKEKVEKGVTQIDKAETVLKEFRSDIGDIKITKVLVLPNVTSDQLKKALQQMDTKVFEDLCASLKTDRDLSVVVSHCLTSDCVSPTTQPRPSQKAMEELFRWWKRITSPCPTMTEDIYDELLSRFCGPATAVKIPTVSTPHKVIETAGQAVAETGLQFSILALYPSQLLILQNAGDTVFLAGPPGTGKSVVLAMKGRQWLLEGKTAHVVSTQYKGRAASIILQQQLQKSKDPPFDAQKVVRHEYNFDSKASDVDAAVSTLSASALNKELFIIIDEVGSRYRDRFKDFCTKLMEVVPSACLWAADLNSENIPKCLHEARMTTMLRCPPVVAKEVQKSNLLAVEGYSYGKLAITPTEGPPIRWLNHRGLKSHTEGEVKNCPACGKEIARTLRELDVGGHGTDGLQYRDVLVIYYNPDDEHQAETSSGSQTPSAAQAAPGVVQGLTESRVSVRVLRRHDTDEAYRQVALAIPDQVTVSHWENVSGLERRIVVGMGDVTDIDRFYVMSRCTSQLVWIESREPHTTALP